MFAQKISGKGGVRHRTFGATARENRQNVYSGRGFGEGVCEEPKVRGRRQVSRDLTDLSDF